MVGVEVGTGLLKVTRALWPEYDVAFDEACGALLHCPQQELTIDFGCCSYVNNCCLGIVAATFYQAQAQGKKLRVIATLRVVEQFRTMGFAAFIMMEVSGASFWQENS